VRCLLDAREIPRPDELRRVFGMTGKKDFKLSHSCSWLPAKSPALPHSAREGRAPRFVVRFLLA
jgi:hypothetical protein